MEAPRALTLGLALLLVPLVGCIGSEPTDQGELEPTDTAVPDANVLPDTISGIEPVTTLETDGGGTGIWIDEARDLLLSANGGGGLQIVNITDPGAPSLVGTLDDVYARDVDLLRLDDRSLALLAGGSEGIHVVDVTDPTEPELLATADEYDAHNIAAVPGTSYVYDSTAIGVQAKLTNPVVPVLDVSDPSDPTWETIEIPTTVNGQPVQSDGCHDITVRMDLEMAYCAGGGGWYARGGGETFVWDLSDGPLSPAWVGVIDNPSIVYHHQALASEDGDLLFINDEFIAPNCHRGQAGPAEVKQSTAAMWIYNITDPSSPQLESYVQAPSQGTPEPGQVPNCGSHFGDLVDGTDIVAWAWYQGGTLLIDVSDPANPAILDHEAPAGSTWDARHANGFIYGSSGDLQVFEIV